MIEILEQHGSELAELCQRHRVRTLEIFGSGVDGTFDPTRSDLDFLVEFLPLESGQHADAYFGLLQGLEDLFQRKIDLVMPRAVTNRYFLDSINRNRRLLYAA
jgi:uncharacterized protein